MQYFRQKIIETYNGFKGKNFTLLKDFYADDVHFRDPLVSLYGLPNLIRYYEHAYRYVTQIEFEFDEILKMNDQYSAPWKMTLSVRGLNSGQPYSVNGLSRLSLNSWGLVNFHQDYLDLSEMIYEKIPIQGSIIRLIKNRLKPDLSRPR